MLKSSNLVTLTPRLQVWPTHANTSQLFLEEAIRPFAKVRFDYFSFSADFITMTNFILSPIFFQLIKTKPRQKCESLMVFSEDNTLHSQ